MHTNSITKTISIFLAGDSTVANYPANEAPMAGWGQLIGKYFKENIIIRNYALPGRSSKSFIDEGVLDKILKEIKENDYLLIQFGHNDEKKYDPSRYSNPDNSYKEYLKQYINGARQHGAIPILITPVSRRTFDKNNNIECSHGKYPDSMKDLANTEQVTLIDLTRISKNYFESLGAEKTKNIFLHLKPGENKNYINGVNDNTHFHENGANEIGHLIVKELKSDSTLNKFIL
ncbi:rhamnogalacturonan acetylesterase [Clostridium felsineum]|uniref:rhamnogalacturonan acetylesterase n=1 Tax=Clostridium felsineum TaxID=36839 RepID=UPI00098C101C|nr:rhamnogalacturonan acetylesterase [Clostridium felsineum]URZ16537.1 Rhamnogalacturonan acetylesterase RhgT [Clostridium felsineum DSM 794]